jgi:hypothetical protein
MYNGLSTITSTVISNVVPKSYLLEVNKKCQMSDKSPSYLHICQYCGKPISEHVPDSIKWERRVEKEARDWIPES